MADIRIYSYAKCQTCRKALQFLDQHRIGYELVDIIANPPQTQELKSMLANYDGELKKLFNTSGELYRELGMKDKMVSLSVEDALALLAKHGKLVKRPFVLTKAGKGRVGFKEEEWLGTLLPAKA